MSYIPESFIYKKKKKYIVLPKNNNCFIITDEIKTVISGRFDGLWTNRSRQHLQWSVAKKQSDRHTQKYLFLF